MKALTKRLQALERQACPNSVLLLMPNGRKRPISADSIVETYQALMERAEEWHAAGGTFPLPEDVIRSIPQLPPLLEAVSVERDLLTKFPNIPAIPVIDSIRLLVEEPRDRYREMRTANS